MISDLRVFLRHDEGILANYYRAFRRAFRSHFTSQELKPGREFLLDMLPSNSIGCEIGVHRGDLSVQILNTLRPIKLHLVDPWQYMPEFSETLYGGSRGRNQKNMDRRYKNVMKQFRNEIAANQVIVHRCTSIDAAATFKDNYFDFVYIDANHAYEYVKQDLHVYFDKVKSGGLICGDDYSTHRWYKDDVCRAVDEFVMKFNVKLVEIRSEQFIIRKN